MTTLIKKYNDARVYLINDAGIVQKMALSILFAIILAVASQIKIFLSFTPVPINLGTFAVCMAGMTLGCNIYVSRSRWAARYRWLKPYRSDYGIYNWLWYMRFRFGKMDGKRQYKER